LGNYNPKGLDRIHVKKISLLQWKRNLSHPPLVETGVEKVIGVEKKKTLKKKRKKKKII